MKDGSQALKEAIERKERQPIECRGRNGWFEFHRFHILSSVRSNEAYLDIYSKKQGNHAPIHFHGPTDNMIALFEEIVAQLKVKMAMEEKTNEPAQISDPAVKEVNA